MSDDLSVIITENGTQLELAKNWWKAEKWSMRNESSDLLARIGMVIGLEIGKIGELDWELEFDVCFTSSERVMDCFVMPSSFAIWLASGLYTISFEEGGELVEAEANITQAIAFVLFSSENVILDSLWGLMVSCIR